MSNDQQESQSNLPSAEEIAEQNSAFLERVRDKALLTTGEVARLCQVAPRTVVNWIDSGRLTAQRSAGGKHRLVPREAFLRFLNEHGMPTDGLTGGAEQA